MSEENQKKFFVDRAKQGRATCKKCKQKLEKGGLRLAKAAPNPFGEGVMKMWHHVPCMFEVFSRQRATTAKIETPDDIEGWDDLDEQDQKEILTHLPNCKDWKVVPKTPSNESSGSKEKAEKKGKGKSEEKKVATTSKKEPHKDDSFREFRRICALIAAEDSYTGKTAIVKDWFSKGSDGDSFKGDLLLWCRLLLPGVVKRVYNLESKQLIKLFSRILGADQDDMLEHLEQGDVADTITVFFEKSERLKSAKKSTITMQDVDKFLEGLSGMTKEDEQTYHFTQMAKNCTLNDLKMIIRLVKHDLRIKAGSKHILEAVHPEAYQAFQMSRDLKAVLSKVAVKSEDGSTKKTSLNISATLMTPVLPMLAEACKSVEAAMKKCPNGMYSEIKYDGERVQVHKRGSEFKYFSRSLKAVMPHKVRNLEDYIPQAFPHGKDLILDSEVLLVDVNTGKPLPFGSLGKHKQNEFQDAQVCLFVFDCIYYNGEPLFNKPIMERRQILLDNMKEIPNRVVFSQMEEIHDPKDLRNMIEKVLKLGLEGLVLKDLMSTYEPGKRHWLKVKKDYLFGGAMADSVDLVVLGAFFGTGQKGGMMSVFLMGCYDPHRRKWCTVTKVHTGHDDKTLDRLQKELDMVKISKDPSKVPDWLLCTKTMIPDFVARDPKAQPVWEITGAEFTQHEVHTAAGISVRFPRVTKIRSDKNWETATSLPELKELFKTSKDVDFSLHASDEASTARKGASSRPSSAASSKPSTSTVDSGSDTEVEEYIPVKIRKTEKPDPKRSPQKAMKPTATKAKREAVEVSPKKKRKEEEYVLKDPLPDIFTGVKLVLPRRLDSGDRRLLERYLVAYGGVLLDEDEVGEATHVIHMEGEPDENVDWNTWARSARHVQLDWLWASIKLGNLQDTRRYAVTKPPSRL